MTITIISILIIVIVILCIESDVSSQQWVVTSQVTSNTIHEALEQYEFLDYGVTADAIAGLRGGSFEAIMVIVMHWYSLCGCCFEEAFNTGSWTTI